MESRHGVSDGMMKEKVSNKISIYPCPYCGSQRMGVVYREAVMENQVMTYIKCEDCYEMWSEKSTLEGVVV